MRAGFGHGVDLADGVAVERAVVRRDDVRITVLTPTLLRLEYDPDARFEDRPSFFALHRRHAPPRFSAGQEGDHLVVQTDELHLRYRLGSGFFTADNLSIELSPSSEQSRARKEAVAPTQEDRAGQAAHACRNAPESATSVERADEALRWRPGDTNRRNLGGTVRTLDNCRGPLRLDDGLLSRDGWFLLDDTRTPVFTRDWVEARLGDGRRDWFFFGYGSNFAVALRDLVTVSGRVPVPPPFVFGNWYSRYWPYSAEDYRRLVEEFAEHDFPLDVLVMDMDWHKPGWTGYSWNRELIPDPDGLLKFFKERGLAVTLNLHPASGVHPHEDAYEAFAHAMGVEASARKPIPFDCTSPRFMEHYFKLLHHPIERQGVDFWWLDWQQQKTSAIARLDPLTWLNHLHYHNLGESPERDAQADIQVTLEDRPLEDAPLGDRLLGDQPPVDCRPKHLPLGDRLSSRSCDRPPLIFSRWGGWGSQRYPIQFSGDAESTWEVLQFEVKLTACAGNAGCVYWSHDVGGHWSLEGRCDPELFVRWLAFGALSPILRVHSTRDPLNDRRPWLDGELYTSAARKACHLRRALRPYLLRLAEECRETGLPLCRPMYLDHPHCDDAYRAEHQYLLGPSLLVVPVTRAAAPRCEGVQRQDRPSGFARASCWLPPGDWVEWETGTTHHGPAWMTFEVALDAVLLFIRAGDAIPLPDTLRRPDGVRLLARSSGAPSHCESADSIAASHQNPARKCGAKLAETDKSESDEQPSPSGTVMRWLDEWFILGPFPPDSEHAVAIRALERAARPDPLQTGPWEAGDGLMCEWRRYRTIASTVADPAHGLNHTVNMKAVFGEPEAIGLAATHIPSPKGGRVTLLLRHDDPLTLYVNGRAAYCCTKVRPVYDPPERIPVDLLPGLNRIVIQQRQFGDRWGFDLAWRV